jgi:transcription antitermination factor NusG
MINTYQKFAGVDSGVRSWDFIGGSLASFGIIMYSSPWFALHVRRNCEKLVAVALRGKGYAEFLPLYQKLSQWSDRRKEIELPLFSGYVFCSFEISQRLPILTIPGVIQVVSFGNKPEPIDEQELDLVRRFVTSGLYVEPWPFLKAGDVVAVKHGSLTGLEGILVEVKNRYRLVISVSLLQRSVAVEIDRAWVSPVVSFPKNRTEQTSKLLADA